MYYLEVLVAGASYHGNDVLTYGSEKNLQRGALVTIPIRSKEALGVVVRAVPKPSFAVKPINSIIGLPLLSEKSLELLDWMKDYYPSPLGIITQQFLPKALPKKPVDSKEIDVPEDPNLPPLTKDQKAALSTINAPGTYLLHGETGTGKTRVYIELAKKSISAQRSAIILTPEIGLTSQLAYDFRTVFGEKVIVIHSQLTEVTRQRLWVSLLKEPGPVVVIGPRSALFSPIKNIGLIVVDEAHETAYKQDQAPYYHTSRVASKLAELHDAPFVLGSATPLVSDYFLATAKQRPIIRMEQTAASRSENKKDVTVIDLRNKALFTKKTYISDELIQSISQTLAKREQTLLFLNRRGTARVILCENCGWQAVCPHCDLPLVYHGDSHRMQCHTCNYIAPSPSSCPDCYNVSVVFKSIGTKAVVDEITHLFPDARIMRFDTDNKKAERIDNHYDAIKKGDVDILIGTQTLAKGLDLPRLGLVGVIIADTSLFFPDFSASERTYQLLSQVIGRVGRGHRESKVILQTYDPNSALLKSVIEKDWTYFYQKEIAERKAFLFPPFCYLLKLSCKRASYKSAQKAAESFATTLQNQPLRVQIEGPAPSFHERVQNKYQWQIVVKAKDRNELIKIIRMLPSGWSYDIDPMNLL